MSSRVETHIHVKVNSRDAKLIFLDICVSVIFVLNGSLTHISLASKPNGALPDRTS